MGAIRTGANSRMPVNQRFYLMYLRKIFAARKNFLNVMSKILYKVRKFPMALKNRIYHRVIVESQICLNC